MRCGVVGAAIAIAGIVGVSFPVLLLGSLLIGFGNSANQLSRYAAANLSPPDRRASAIGTMVWAATIGAVIGPNLVETPSGEVAMALGLPALAEPAPRAGGPRRHRRPDIVRLPPPRSLGSQTEQGRGLDAATYGPMGTIDAGSHRSAGDRCALVIGQFVMVLMMTMTPLHMTDRHHSLQAVGS